jgi:hypothetical protein
MSSKKQILFPKHKKIICMRSLDKEELGLIIDDTSGTLDFELALNIIEYFRFRNEETESIISRGSKAIGRWEKTLEQIGIARTEIDLLRSALRF